jgi:GA-binding protein transcription factor beta
VTVGLHRSAFGHADVVLTLLGSRVNIDARNKVEKTPLHLAASEGNAHIVQYLLEHNAEVDACDFVSTVHDTN